MSREIKFKAYAKDLQEILGVVELCWKDGILESAILCGEHRELEEYIDGLPRYIEHSYWEAKDIILLEYIGKKDHNGREVCERDIAKFPEHDYLAEIKYYPEHAAFLFDSHDPETRNNPDAYMLWSDDFEIIGNTTEHPELMDK